jgi:peptidoglycan hydrolase CwlO-like protein
MSTTKYPAVVKQNPRAQQAYRARKEKLRENLQAQIYEWHAKYDCLLRSYADQSNEIRKLQSKIKQLRAQPDLLEPQAFDLVPRYTVGVRK